MKNETKLEEYECCNCGLKDIPDTTICPVLHIETICPPKVCKCGSHDFIAHITQVIQLTQPAERIVIDIDMTEINRQLINR